MKKLKSVKDNNSKISSDDIENCPDEKTLQKYKDTIEGSLIEVKQQLDAAIGKAAADGTYSDPIWYAKATSAKRVLGFLHQRILVKEREFKYNKIYSIEKHFMDCAREVLDSSQFLHIFDLAKEAEARQAFKIS